MQRVSLINSNNTQKNSDYDFTKLWKWLLGNQGGIESVDMFAWDSSSKRLSAGSAIANAYILCTRTTSSPIPNQSFLAQFEFTGQLEFLNATNGDKIFIEIKNNLINDPTLIEDLDTQTEYAKGLGIGEIKIAKNYPSHNNYIKLWEIQGSQAIDKRKLIELPKIQHLQTQLDAQQASLSEVQSQVTELMSAGSSSKLAEQLYPLGESVSKNDCLYVEDTGRIEDITTFQAIGKETANQKVAHKIIGNGVSGNSISLPLCAVGNSPIPLTVRIEGGENQPNGQLVHTQAQATISKTQMAYHPIVIEAGYDRDESTSNRYNAITFVAKRDFVCVGLIKSTRCNATGAELKIGGATKTTGTVTGNTIIRSQAQVITAGQQVELWTTGGTRKAAKGNSSYTVNTDYFTLNTPYDFESLLLVDCATVSFPASFVIPTSAWVVLSHGSNTVNNTNYYGLGLRDKHSSTRYLATNNGSWKVLRQHSITNRENNVAGGTFNDGQKNTWRGVNLTAKNAVLITRIDKINASQANKVRIIKSGAIVGTYNLSGNTATISPAIVIEKGEKFTIEFAKGNNEYYVSQGFNMANSSAGTSDFYGARYSINGAISGGSDQGYNLNKIFVDVQDYTANTTIITGAGLHKQVLAKTNAQHPYKISGDGYARFAQSAGATGTIVPVSYYGQHSGMNGLIPGMRYYLSGAPGLITTNASDGVLECGLAINSTALLTMGVKGKLYTFQQQLRTNLQTHSHPLINQARFVVVSYGDYEFHRQRMNNFAVTTASGSSTYRTGITRVGDTITHRTNSTPYSANNITFTFYL